MDSDYDSAPQPRWTEAQWQEYLLSTDAHIERFEELYHRYMEDPARIDRAAKEMGWLVEWENGEYATTDSEESEALPFTIHTHPVYIATRAIGKSLRDICLAYARTHNELALIQMAVVTTLAEAQTQALLGLECQDIGDMNLTVCHIKRAMSELNHALRLIDKIREGGAIEAELFSAEAKLHIFDLRELWLRVNAQVRADIQQQEGEE